MLVVVLLIGLVLVVAIAVVVGLRRALRDDPGPIPFKRDYDTRDPLP